MINVLTLLGFLTAFLIGCIIKMAVSFIRRGFLSRWRKNVFHSYAVINSRLFSSDGKGPDTFSETFPEKSAVSSESSGDVSRSASITEPIVDSIKNASSFQLDSSDLKVEHSKTERALDRFAKVIEMVKNAQERDDSTSEEKTKEDTNESFASMFRKSKFVSLGEPKGRLVEGRIIEVMENNLYIDFGGKFHCVCPRPQSNSDKYHRGTKVVINLQATEMSSAFLGSDMHVTLLEADGILLGLSHPDKSRQSTVKS